MPRAAPSSWSTPTSSKPLSPHRYYDPELPVSRISLSIRRPEVVRANRADYGFGAHDRLLVTIGRLVARKAVDQLIALLDRLPATTRLLVIGTGPKEAELRRQAAAAGVADRVHFLSFVPERTKHEILAISDLFVSTSQHEGFGLVFLEAMASGLPVVCYDRADRPISSRVGRSLTLSMCLVYLVASFRAVEPAQKWPVDSKKILGLAALRAEKS